VDPVIQGIRDARESGATRAELRRQLIAQGYEDADARVLIDESLDEPSRTEAGRVRGGGGGRGSGILGTIAFVVILNGLSYAFDWGWYFW